MLLLPYIRSCRYGYWCYYASAISALSMMIAIHCHTCCCQLPPLSGDILLHYLIHTYYCCCFVIRYWYTMLTYYFHYYYYYYAPLIAAITEVIADAAPPHTLPLRQLPPLRQRLMLPPFFITPQGYCPIIASCRFSPADAATLLPSLRTGCQRYFSHYCADTPIFSPPLRQSSAIICCHTLLSAGCYYYYAMPRYDAMLLSLIDMLLLLRCCFSYTCLLPYMIVDIIFRHDASYRCCYTPPSAIIFRSYICQPRLRWLLLHCYKSKKAELHAIYTYTLDKKLHTHAMPAIFMLLRLILRRSPRHILCYLPLQRHIWRRHMLLARYKIYKKKIAKRSLHVPYIRVTLLITPLLHFSLLSFCR